MMPPLLSILIPTYNRAGYLPAALRSAVGQTVRDVEVIVLDDASPDATGEAVGPFLADSRVRYVRHPANVGIAGNWRRGIAAARGEFFCLLHDDDWLEPDFAERLLDPLRREADLAVSFSDHYAVDAAGTRVPEAHQFIRRQFGRDRLASGRVADFAETALIDLSVPVGAAIYRRAMVTPDFIADGARGAIDMWLLYEIARRGLGGWYVGRPLMNYRMHAGGMSASRPFDMVDGHLFRLSHALAEPALRRLWPRLRLQKAHQLEWRGIHLLRAGERSAARRALLAAIRMRPTVRAAASLALAAAGPAGSWWASATKAKA